MIDRSYIHAYLISFFLTIATSDTLIHTYRHTHLHTCRFATSHTHSFICLQTPLHLAALRGNHEVVRYLIEDFGADFNVKDKNGCTPLALAMKKHQFATEWIIRRLVSKGSVCDLVVNLGFRRLIDRRWVDRSWYLSRPHQSCWSSLMITSHRSCW